MAKEFSEKLTRNDAYKFIFCTIILFILFAPKLEFVAIETVILSILKPDLSNYPNLNPPIFLSIGEALSSIAILFAIYQFKEEKWRIALRVRSYIRPTVFFAVVSGIVFAIVSSVVFFKNPTNIFQISIFWQVLSSLFIAFSIIFLFLRATNKNLFSKKNARKFYEVMVWELARPSPDRVNYVLNTLLDNLENICKAATTEQQTETGKLASAILDVVLGEGSIVDLVTTKRLDGLHYILFVIEKYNVNHRQAKGVSRIVKNLFADQNSFLYKHLEMSGLALSANLYDQLFGSEKMLINFRLFSWPSFDYTSNKCLNGTQINVFIKSLSKSIETYLKSSSVPAGSINAGISGLSDILGDLCQKISNAEERGVDTKYEMKDEWWSIHTIANFLGHDYPFLAYRDTLNETTKEKEKNATEASFNSGSTINSAIAAAIYKAFSQLSSIKDTNDIYHIVHELLSGMIQEESLKEGYRNPFEKRIWEQVANNLVNKHYPASLRTFLVSLGYYLSSDTDNTESWIGRQTERMRRLLYIDLKPLLENHEKMANDELMEKILLPSPMSYKDGKFSYLFGFGRGPEKVIAEPLPNSQSALIGIDLDNVYQLM